MRALDLALDCHRMGAVAQERGQVDQAQAWYLRALNLFESQGSPTAMAFTLAQLGLLAVRRQCHEDGLRWLAAAFRLTAEAEAAPARDNTLIIMTRLFIDLGRDEFETLWESCEPAIPPPTGLLEGFLHRIQ